MNLSRTVAAASAALRSLAILVVFAVTALWAVDTLRNPETIRAAVSQAFSENRLGNDEGFENFGEHRISHFSECVGLSTAIQPLAANSLAFTLQSPALLWQAPKPICRSLKEELANNPQPYFSYSRYWHGYRLITEPMLSLASYASLQVFCRELLMISLFLVAVPILLAASRARQIVPVGIAVFLGLVFVVTATDFGMLYRVPTHAISVSVLLIGFAYALGFRRREGVTIYTAAPGFFIVGAVYNFFDFLYNPDLLAFLLGWAFFVRSVLIERRAIRPALAQAILLQAIAIGGYMAMWLVKWILALASGLLFHQSTTVPAQDFGRWFGGGDGVYLPFKATYVLILESVALPLGWWPLAVCALALVATAIVSIRLGRASAIFAMLALMLFPVLILELKANHTLQHAPFTFRFIPFAVMMTTLGALAVLRTPPKAVQSRAV